MHDNDLNIARTFKFFTFILYPKSLIDHTRLRSRLNQQVSAMVLHRLCKTGKEHDKLQ